MINEQRRIKMYTAYFVAIMAFMALSEITHQILEVLMRCG